MEHGSADQLDAAATRRWAASCVSLSLMLGAVMVESRINPTFARRERSASEAGFTLLELLVVLGIIALLATVAGPQVLRYLGKARTDTAKAQISAISTALELYSLDNGSFPSQDLGLAALVQPPQNGVTWHGPYLKRAEGLIDPWGRPYNYKFPGQKGPPDVFTLGHDNAPGGTGEDQDLYNN
jgi:general secretion pathway protein G